ncbi:unnamed protein product, partial [Prorocentrum cordatum]
APGRGAVHLEASSVRVRGRAIEARQGPDADVAVGGFADRVMLDAAANRSGKLLKLGENFSLQVLNSSSTCEFPRSGDQVTVHYTGALADGGRQFDSSRSRGEPIQFILGRGKVIRGWDQGLKMMCLGERGILHVPSYKGYGTDGAPPAIPPNAALDFDVELLGINGKFAPQYEPPLAPRPANNSVALGARPGGGRAASAARGAGARGASPGAGAALAAAAGCAVLAAA